MLHGLHYVIYISLDAHWSINIYLHRLHTCYINICVCMLCFIVYIYTYVYAINKQHLLSIQDVKLKHTIPMAPRNLHHLIFKIAAKLAAGADDAG